jgi:hypothetical protein
LCTWEEKVESGWALTGIGPLNAEEYPQPDIRGPMPVNAHPDSTFSSHVHNDWTQVQLGQQVRFNATESEHSDVGHDLTYSPYV